MKAPPDFLVSTDPRSSWKVIKEIVGPFAMAEVSVFSQSTTEVTEDTVLVA